MSADAQPGKPLQRMALRAYDVSGRTARAGRASVAVSLSRWRARWFLILQAGLTAALAWFLAQRLLGHHLPFFAPVAAIITLGVTFGHRLRRGVEISIGVAVGVLVGDLFVRYFGSGPWQVAVAVLVATSIATLLGAGQLMIIQAGVQSATIIGLAPTGGQALDRWVDAIIGATIALLVATVAPAAPVRRPALAAATVLDEIAATLQAAAAELRTSDAAAGEVVLEQARRTQVAIDALRAATAEGLAVVRHSPFRRHQLAGVSAYAELVDPIDHASRNLRVLARRCAVALWRGESVPEAYLDQLEELGAVVRFMADELRAGRLPVAARDRLVRLGEASAHVGLVESISAVVILAQVRSMITDLLELTGMDYADARERIPEMD